MQGFTHFDDAGNAVMVDVSGKEPTARFAVARGSIRMKRATFNAIRSGTTKKGDVLGVARVAGIMATKQTSALIPLCHSLSLEQCTLDFSLPEPSLEDAQVDAVCSVRLSGKTGAEMEALTGVSVALLTIYDMCKAVDRGMVLSNICLVEKAGGKSGHWSRGSGVSSESLFQT